MGEVTLLNLMFLVNLLGKTTRCHSPTVVTLKICLVMGQLSTLELLTLKTQVNIIT